tara:strand:- start:23633 stop:25807 length:2175 start_codon:yes stop_codon:yes gene_type:complete
MKNLLGYLFILTLVFLSSAHGAKITSDELNLGKPGSFSDKVINLGPTRKIRSNETLGVLEFSNDDGALWKKIGSGSGSGGDGGVNSLSAFNPSFEDGLTNWTTSGGTLTQEDFTNGIEGDTKFARYVATGAGQYVETTLVTVSDKIGFGCMADLRYFQGDNAFTYAALDSSNNLLSSGDIADLNDGWLKAPTITFRCPDAGETYKLRITSTGAGTIDFDQAYLGSNKNVSPIGLSPAFIGSIEWRDTPNCEFTNATGPFDAFNPDNDCDDFPRTLRGEAQDFSSGVQPDISFPILKKGSYILTLEGSFGDFTNSINSPVYFRSSISSGALPVVTSRTVESNGGSPDGVVYSGPTIVMTFDLDQDYPAALIRLQGAASNASNPATIRLSQTGLKMSLHYFPTSNETQQAFNSEQANFFIDASISGGLSNNLTVTSGSVSNSISSPNWTLTENKGSSQIPCESEESSGVTCSTSQENLGISFIAPVRGAYEVCGSVTIRQGAQDGGTQDSDPAFRWELTENNSPSPITKGTGRFGFSRQSTGAVSGLQKEETGHYWCDTIDIESVGKATFRLKYLQTVNTTSTVIVAQGANELAVNIKVRLVENFVSRPIVDNQVSTRSRAGSEKGACHVINTVAGAVSFDSSDPDCWFINSLQRFNVGLVEVVFTDSNLKCVATTLNADDKVGFTDSSNNRIDAFVLPQTVRTNTVLSSGAAVDSSYSIFCSKNK